VDRALSKGEEEDIVRVIGSKSKSKGLSDLLSLLTLTAISSIQHHLSESVSSMEGILSEFAKVEKAAPGLIASNRNANVTVTESTISSNNPIKSSTSKSKSKSKSTITIPDAIDDLIQTLETAKHSLQSSSTSTSSSSSPYPINPSILLAEISSSISQTQKSISERQKEFNSALSKLSKALEKKFPIQVSNISDPNLFNGKEPQRALEAVVMEHLIRENKWETAQKFAKVSNQRW
jgi:hypothetical protein